MINEIHVDPDVKTELVEFIELFNHSGAAMDLSGWRLEDAVEYMIPEGTILQAGGYLVIAQEPSQVQAKFGVQALGPFVGRISNEGEMIRLMDADGNEVDRVDYQIGFPWPIVGDPPGYSMELIHPSLDNQLGGSWRPSVRGGASPSEQGILLAARSQWKYFKGDESAAGFDADWRALDYDDSSWSAGGMPVGYGDNLVQTNLEDMRGNYSSVYHRTTFEVAEYDKISGLTLEALYDDGMVVWINGTEVFRVNVPSGDLSYDRTAGSALEQPDYIEQDLANPKAFLRPGVNVIAVHGFNASVGGSSDFWVDVQLRARLGGGADRGPTPGALNSVYSESSPPILRHVEHRPDQPTTSEPVAISVKATDPDGVQNVRLHYQVVEPGGYIELNDAEYQTEWQTVEMESAATLGEDYYEAVLPPSLQAHRRLIRYRIEATDMLGATVAAPYPEDPQPNFAYFVYDGVPAWTGAARPGSTPEFTVSGEEMGRLPTYHLISKRGSVENSTWFQGYGGSEYRWWGTLIYDGKVYDHVRYRARGGVWRYAMGKNMWKFDFNRGHDFQARDNYGDEYDVKWTKLNLGANIQQGNFDHRGEQGMFESVGFRMFDLAGVPAPDTHWAQFRIIDEADESASGDQYRGDYWGLYLAVEQMNGRFLDEHDLPDGNLFKMENGTGPPGASGEIKNQGPYQTDDYSDLISFRNVYESSRPTEGWWESNVNVDGYFRYQTVVQGIHHYDICCGKNYYFFNNPQSGLWEVLPWDLDLTWADNMYLANGGGVDMWFDDVFSIARFQYEMGNTIREIRDLLFNEDQAFQLIDEYARIVKGPLEESNVLAADRAMWDYNPVMANGSIVNLSKAGQGRFYEFPLESRTNQTLRGSFDAGVQIMKNYVKIRSALLDDMASDGLTPARPSIEYVGPEGFPLNDLVFETGDYQGPSSFQAIKWRLAEVTDPDNPIYSPDEPHHYEIETDWESEAMETFQPQMRIPSGAVEVGRSYRVRVRMLNAANRWSHWSEPAQFIAGAPDQTSQLIESLRVTELMYHAPEGGEFDFIEIHNAGEEAALDLTGVLVTQGVDFSFPDGFSLAPGEYAVLAKSGDTQTFRGLYGLDASVRVLGPFEGSLDNGGERVTLRAGRDGPEIVSFEYDDENGWPLAADGTGHSLVPAESEAVAETTLDYFGHWRTSAWIHGSPGREDPILPPSLIVNELMALTDLQDPQFPEHDSNDWIEVLNAGGEAVDFAGWYLSDDPDKPKKWALPDGTLEAGARISFDETHDFHNPLTTGFGLSKDGEQLLLSHFAEGTPGRVADAVLFHAQPSEHSLARIPDGGSYWMPANPSRDAINEQSAVFVSIQEIMYHYPDASDGADLSHLDYIEVANVTGQTIALSGEAGPWRLSGTIELEFSSDAALPPGGVLVAVEFDPQDSTALEAFRQAYPDLSDSAVLAGPYQGRLNNDLGRVVLERPQPPDVPAGDLGWIVVDEAYYLDQAPWPLVADGGGSSLRRISPRRSGFDAENWTAADPTPGMSEIPAVQDTDSDGLPDNWESMHGLDPGDASDAAEDRDGDGLSALEEYWAGTDPNDPASVLELDVRVLPDGRLALEFEAVPGRSYWLEETDALGEGSWRLLREEPPNGESKTIQVIEPMMNGEAGVFYRLLIPGAEP